MMLLVLAAPACVQTPTSKPVHSGTLPACQGAYALWTNCRGTITFPDGAKYVGAFKDSRQNGQGTYTWPDGSQYIGGFKDDVLNGEGTLTWADGSRYAGTWKDGKWNGQGTYTSVEGGGV